MKSSFRTNRPGKSRPARSSTNSMKDTVKVDYGHSMEQRNELFTSVMPLALGLARKFHLRHKNYTTLCDCVQVANLAAWNATRTYNPNDASGSKFSGHAYRAITHQLRGCLYDSGVVRFSKHEVAKLSKEDRYSALSILQPVPVSTLGGAFKDGQQYRDYGSDRIENADLLQSILRRLNERDQLVLTLRSNGASQSQVARAIGVTYERARQIEIRAIQRARKIVSDLNLSELY